MGYGSQFYYSEFISTKANGNGSAYQVAEDDFDYKQKKIFKPIV